MTKQYLETIAHVFQYGEKREDRTGTGTLEVFGHQVRYDLKQGFPLLTTKDMRALFEKVFYELKWFLRGDTNIKYLLDHNVNIWNADAYRWFREHNPETRINESQFIELIREGGVFSKQYGDLGRIYGKQWTDFGGMKITYERDGEEIEIKGINQIKAVIEEIKQNPTSRRLIISAWNPFDRNGMALPPCHVLIQFYVTNDGRLSCLMYQRSADLFLGVPFNIASYSLLTHMIAYMCDLDVGEFIHTFGCLHIYNNHMEQMSEQLQREPKHLPQLLVEPFGREIEDITDFEFKDFELVGYTCHGKLTGKVSVGL